MTHSKVCLQIWIDETFKIYGFEDFEVIAVIGGQTHSFNVKYLRFSVGRAKGDIYGRFAGG